jgi:hypothetical protein
MATRAALAAALTIAVGFALGTFPLRGQEPGASQQAKAYLFVTTSKNIPAETAKPEASVNLFLRPNGESRSLYVFVRNREAGERKYLLELLENDQKVEGAPVSLTVPGNTTMAVPFAKPAAAAAKEAPEKPASKPAGAPVPPGQDWRGSSHKVAFRLVNVTDKPNEQVAVVGVNVATQSPRQYLGAEATFAPGGAGTENQLTVTVTAKDEVDAKRPCEVQLVLSPERIPGLQTTRSPGSTYTRELSKAGQKVRLVARDLRFRGAAPEAGLVSVTAGGLRQAFTYKATFAQGGGLAARLDRVDQPLIFVDAPRYSRPGKLPVFLEVANAPAPPVTIEVGIDLDRNGVYEDDEIVRLPGAHDGHIYFNPTGKDGELQFQAVEKDWEAKLDVRDAVGNYALRVRLLKDDKPVKLFRLAGEPVEAVTQNVTFDDIKPLVKLGTFPRQLVRGQPLRVQATASALSPIQAARFFLGKPVAGKDEPPPMTEVIDGEPVSNDRIAWTAALDLKPDTKGPVYVSAQAVSAVGLSAVDTVKIELVDPPAPATTGTIKGIVTEGGRPQPRLKVVLQDSTGKAKDEVKTNDKGEFEFKDVAPGNYQVSANDPDSQTKGDASAAVEKGKTKTVNLELMR